MLVALIISLALNVVLVAAVVVMAWSMNRVIDAVEELETDALVAKDPTRFSDTP